MGGFTKIPKLSVGDLGTEGTGDRIALFDSDGELVGYMLSGDGFIPLSGTEVGKPITGDLEMFYGTKIFNTEGGLQGVAFSDFSDITGDGFTTCIFNTSEDRTRESVIATSGYEFFIRALQVIGGELKYTGIRSLDNDIYIINNHNNSKGVVSDFDFTPNYPTDGNEDKIFPQIKYVKEFILAFTNAELLALPSPIVGKLYYNTTLNKQVFYNGTSWEQLTSTAM